MANTLNDIITGEIEGCRFDDGCGGMMLRRMM